ncbi:MAG: hypothetical protein ABEL51_14525 [Salinibacter sp.]
MLNRIFIILVTAGILTMLLIGPTFFQKGQNHGIQLQAPPFSAVEAQAQEQNKGVNFLEQEAGIAAYAKGEEALDLQQVESAFKSVETASDSYIIGEVALSDLPEKVHPHVYVNQDGWVVAYYSKAEPASKMMQWIGYQGGKVQTTTLEDAIQKIYDSLQRPYPEPGAVNYYDFEHPNANRIMLVTERVKGESEDTLYLTVPDDARLYEASWGLIAGDEAAALDLDDNQIGRTEAMSYSELTGKIKKGFRHKLRVRCHGRCEGANIAAIVLIYQVTGE